MAHVVIPFLMSMLLGRTIDLTTYTIGGDVYDPSDYTEIPIYLTNSSYTVLQENVFPYSHVGLPADLVLRIKSGFIHSSSGALGLDGLLKETSWKSNSVVIAVTSMVQTVYREISYDAQPLPNWTTRVDDSQTHYAHSLIYGGWSAVLYRFKCEVPGEEETVRKILTSVMGVSGNMDNNAVDLWKKALAELDKNEDINGKVTIHVHAYASAPLSHDVTSPDTLLKAIEAFSDDVGRLGQPLFVELRPLHKLNSKYPVVKADHVSDKDMEKLDEMFDDLRSTKTSLRKWMTETLADFSDEDEEKISHLLEHVIRCINIFHKIAGEASIYKPMDRSLMKSAILLYIRGLSPEVETYKQMFLRLKEDLDPDCTGEFVGPIKGVLKVAHNERLELGEVSGGLDECKERCLEEEKCRSIGYAEQLPVLEWIPGDHAHLKITRKEKQCTIYLRSSTTAKVITSKIHGSSRIYNRKCF